ncbi:BAHD acyltransferase At5g47980-like [Pyrus communis]|uniref:BAHD acyltransferase At5g47980-like n=1 Tax=Pyrus communis TaxID=23211 RepID=UPI0035C1BA25
MVSEMKVQVLNKETIKPSSPTPPDLRNLRLSFFDQFEPEIFIPLLLFYRNKPCAAVADDQERSNFLKTSLSEALTHFYPFAGEFQRNDSICCNDHGVAFLQAQVNCYMSMVFDKPDDGILEQLVPTDKESTLSNTDYLLLIQANFFECGGLAIGVSFAHKVSDAFTICKFIERWAAIALGSASTTTDHHAVLLGEFGVSASLFPPLDIFNSPDFAVTLSTEGSITRRFVFDASKIATLKSKAANTTPNPTRVEVVSALIWKCAMQASRSKLGIIKPSMLCPIVNMRKRSRQALAENILGNCVWSFAAMTVESEIEHESLVAKLRKGIEEHTEKYPNGVSGNDIIEAAKESGGSKLLDSDDLDIYTCSSWCRFSFYEADFGWGKPSWVSVRSLYKNTILLMDMRDGDGIEASLTLKEDDMALFENSEELLAYASPNPTVIS